MTKAERIQRKLQRAAQLTREAYELAGGVDRDLEHDLAGAVDRSDRAVDDFQRYVNRERDKAVAAARFERELEEYGRCTRCDTGVPASHLHCEACGWAMDTFGIRAGACHNRDCERYERQQVGNRFSDREAVA